MRSKNGAGGRVSFIQAARRAQIIDAAVATVTEVGYGHASLARIAERAEISKSVISYHFANKADLFEQAVAHIRADWTTHLQPLLAAERTAAARLSVYVHARLAYLRDRRTQRAALAEIIANHRTSDGRRVFDEGVEDTGDLRALLRAGQRSGEFRGFDPAVFAITVSRAIEGVLTHWADHPGTDLTAYGEELVTLFGLAARKPDQRTGQGART